MDLERIKKKKTLSPFRYRNKNEISLKLLKKLHYNTYVDIPLQTIGDENCVGWFSTQIYYIHLLKLFRKKNIHLSEGYTYLYLFFEEKFLFSQIVFKFDQSDYIYLLALLSILFSIFFFLLLCAKDERI